MSNEISLAQAQAAVNAQKLLTMASQAKPDHPYLMRKDVKPNSEMFELQIEDICRILGYHPKASDQYLSGRVLIIPIRQSSRLSTVEMIDETGRKVGLRGSGTRVGGYWTTHPLPATPNDDLEILLCEGVATAMTISAAVSRPVIATFSCQNIEAVGAYFRCQFPKAPLIICADIEKDTCRPIHQALAAAKSLSAKLAIPVFGSNRLPDSTDFNDLARQRGLTAVINAIATAQTVTEEITPAPQSITAAIPPILRDTRRDQVVSCMLQANATFWRDTRGNAYATLLREGRIERHPVRSNTFKNLVRLTFGDAHPVSMQLAGRETLRPGSIADQTLNEALGAFEALALRGDEKEARPRVCKAKDGAIWLDLGRPDWELIKVTVDGWALISGADVPLIRPHGLSALPVPKKHPAALELLRSVLNLPGSQGRSNDSAFCLVLAWLVSALHPEGPYPVLALDGEQGSGKTSTAKMLRQLVDPNTADVRSLPRDERNLVVAARNGRVLCFDNLSGLDGQMADALCRVATGGGLGERALYTNAEEFIAFVQNPILLTGIPSLLGRGDLADRAIAMTLPTIADSQRRTEAEVWSTFREAAPGILALLLDGLVAVLRDGPALTFERLPRMADFMRLACAAAPVFGLSTQAMIEALEANRGEAVAAVIDADAMASALQALALELGIWQGTATELLAEINGRTPVDRIRQKDWPKDGTRISTRIRRIAPALRRTGINIELPEAGGRAGRLITIRAMHR